MFNTDLGGGDELRLLQYHDTLEVYSIIDSNRHTLRNWLGWVDTICSLDDARQYIASKLKRLMNGGGATAGIWSAGKLVGVIGYNGINSNSKVADVGFWLIPAAEGRGLATRSLTALISSAFTNDGLNKIELAIGTQNTRSLAVARRLGFSHEGVRRDAQVLHDQFIDHDLFGLLKSEFRG